MRKRDWRGLLGVIAAAAAMMAFRAVYVEPAVWGSVCLEPGRPFSCLLRDGLNFGQFWQLWGGTALAAAVVAFISRAFWAAPLAVALGAIAVINFNATWGMIGAFTGAWLWLTLTRRPAQEA
jgi:hypothetical protein